MQSDPALRPDRLPEDRALRPQVKDVIGVTHDGAGLRSFPQWPDASGCGTRCNA